MTIIFNGHSYKYETENVCKMFFPCTRFQFLSNPPVCPEGDIILTRVHRGRIHTFLLAYVRISGAVYRRHLLLSNLDDRYEKECERKLAEALYGALQQATGVAVSWGIMTGIRPVKQVHYWREQGRTEEEIRRIFCQDYLVSDQKYQLCAQTAQNQAKMMEASRPDSYSLYVSIPFCPTRCSYCSFVSSAISNSKAKALIQPYVDKLCEELTYLGEMAQELGLRLETIYVGGGTPTSLSTEQLGQLTGCISACFPVQDAREYTIEAGRADTITREKLEVIKQCGATRISINPQTFHDEVLRNIGREHTAKQAVECYELAAGMGFEDINMDFIAGLPGDTLERFCHTIDQAVSLSPSNITVHTLTIKRSSDLYASGGTDLEQLAIGKMVEYAYQKLTAHGYEPYYLYRQKNTLQNLENVGYSKKNYENYYNVYIMEEIHSILAAGAGGVTKLIGSSSKVERIFNYKFPFEYIRDFDELLERKQCIRKFYSSIHNSDLEF